MFVVFRPVLFVVLSLLPLFCASSEIGEYSSKEYWGFYTDSCRQLSGATSKVEKQIADKSDVLFTTQIGFNLERMKESLSKVSASDREPGVLAECEAAANQSRSVLAKATEYEKGLSQKQALSARSEHESSPLYKKAKSLGFSDYEWLTALDSTYRKVGGKKLQSMMIVVDPDCGAHFKAIQKMDPYVLFVPSDISNSACSGRERVAVLPAAGFSFGRGQYIDQGSYYVFQGVLEGKSMDGFPSKVLVIKQVVVKRKK